MNPSDFVCGVLAGWTQVFFGQPFDFVKVRIQTAKHFVLPPRQIVKDIYQEHGLIGFYRGSSSLVLGFAAIIGVEFLVF